MKLTKPTRRATATATATPRATAAPDLSPEGAVCKLDAYGEYDGASFVSGARAVLRQAFGVSDAEIDAVLSDAGGRAGSVLQSLGARTFGDVSQCTAVRANRVVDIVQLVLLGLTVPVVLASMFKRGQSPAMWTTMWGLGVAGAALTAYQMRHTLSLSAKVVWNGSGPAARAMLLLTALTLAVGQTLGYVRDWAPWPVVVGLLGVTAAATVGKAVFLGRSVANPEASYVLAIVSALDRVLTNRRLAAARRAFT